MSARIAGIMLWLLAMLAASAQAQTVEYLHTDALGSVVAVTDANRNVIERREYEPYGSQLTPAVTNGPGYTGHVQDAATSLVYMQQRYYDAQIGRFLSADPVTDDGNTGGNFSRYWYANNNPYSFTDPDGRCGSHITGRIAPYCTTIYVNGGGTSADSSTTGQQTSSIAGGTLSFVDGLLRGFIDRTLDFAPSNWPGLDRQLLAEIGFGGRPDSNIGQLGYDLEPAAEMLGTGGFMAIRTGTSAAASTVAQVLRNKAAGDAFRDALAADLEAAGRQVAIEVYKKTPFGRRFIDIEVSRNGTVLGGVETKVGKSRYHPLQQLKDWYLRYVKGYPVNVARSP